LRAFTFIGRKSFYKTTPLENALKSAFGVGGFLYGEAKPESPINIRVAVTSTNAMEKRPVVMSNYNTGGARDGCELPAHRDPPMHTFLGVRGVY
jgi:hypothetical protein